MDTKEIEIEQHGRSLWYYSWRRLRKNKLAMVGMVVLGLLIFVALFADIISPYNPNDQILEFATKPVNFQGQVLLVKSTNDDKGYAYFPIESFIRQ